MKPKKYLMILIPHEYKIKVNIVSLYKNRKIILEVLDRVENQVLSKYLTPLFFKKYKPGDLDKSLIQEISYGVIALKKIDWIITNFCSEKKLPYRSKYTENGFLSGSLFGKIPDYASHESVELAKETYPAYSSMVNAVLRNAIRQSSPSAGLTGKNLKHVSVYYSFPEWLVKMD